MPENEPTRNLGLELVRVTEAGALGAARLMGRGDKEAGDQAAVDAMRLMLNSIDMDGVVVIGEGEKDEAPMLFNGERVGRGVPPEVDIAVDPVEGTTPLAEGRTNSIATVAIAPRGTMYDPGPFMYMNKIGVGPACKGVVDIEAPVADNLRAVARALDKRQEDVTVVVLDRPRHKDLIAQIRAFGARIRLISDGDVAGSLMACMPETGIDVLMGVGGTPEGVLSACAMRALGGELQGKLYARNEEELNRGIDMGYEFNKVLGLDDLVSSNDVFFAATGITDGELLQGVKYLSHGARTDSLVMRGLSGTIREIVATHQFDKLEKISGNRY